MMTHQELTSLVYIASMMVWTENTTSCARTSASLLTSMKMFQFRDCPTHGTQCRDEEEPQVSTMPRSPSLKCRCLTMSTRTNNCNCRYVSVSFRTNTRPTTNHVLEPIAHTSTLYAYLGRRSANTQQSFATTDWSVFAFTEAPTAHQFTRALDENTTLASMAA